MNPPAPPAGGGAAFEGKVTQDEQDRRFMRLAIALGARGLGQVWPNPAVGCVLVRDGVIVGRGWTQPGGRPHAEVHALAQAGAAARGATAYVSLEPCAHHGKTPPCAEALIKAGVARVVTALTDPDPRVAGRGHDKLRAAGIALSTGVEAQAALAGNAGFLMRVLHGRPMVTLKLALTLDGRIATASGASRWITGAQARRQVHLMRARHDAVLVGAGTVRADDPDLRVRELGVSRQPLRIVTDSRLELPAEARLAKGLEPGPGAAPLWLLHGPAAAPDRRQYWRERGALPLEAAIDADGRIDAAAALRLLGAQGLTRILCEGGGGLAASLIRAGLVDDLVIFSAGHVFGGDGLAGLAALGVTQIGAKPFTLLASGRCGEDLIHHWRRRDFPSDLLTES